VSTRVRWLAVRHSTQQHKSAGSFNIYVDRLDRANMGRILAQTVAIVHYPWSW
jgi:hypothetical protein